MKRCIVLTVTIVFLFSILVMLTGCYPSKPTTMKNLVGTYKLETWTRSYTEERADDGSTITHDYVAEDGIEAYLVITQDGKGYYIYKDNNTPLIAKETKIEYIYDDDEPGKVKEIVYTTGGISGTNYNPAYGAERLGVYYTWREKKLSYTMPAVFGRTYSQTSRYSKVDKATDLSYVQKKLGQTIRTAPYAIAALDGWQIYQGVYDSQNPYIYYALDLNCPAQTANVYWANKEDGVQRSQMNVRVQFSIPDDESPITVTVGDQQLYCTHYAEPATNLYGSYNSDMDMYFYRTAQKSFDKDSEWQMYLDEYAAIQSQQ